MLTALQTRKLTRLFMLYDVDRSGFIERSDYGMVAQMTALAMGHQPASPEYQALYYEYLVGWDNIRAAADSNADDRLTLTEFLLGYDNLMAQRERFDLIIMELVKTIFRLWDRDKDGKVSQEEHAAYWAVFNTTAEEAGDSFRRFDRDGNGYLLTDEMLVNAQEFFFSDDPEAPGNWILGPY